MSNTYIRAELRRRVNKRAGNACEYCLIPVIFGLVTPYHIDHVISEKHGGRTDFDNLALSCPTCNLFKGSDISSYLAESDIIVNLYHPRRDSWSDHFTLKENGSLTAHTDVATATIRLLHLNDPSYIELRALLIKGEVLVSGNEL